MDPLHRTSKRALLVAAAVAMTLGACADESSSTGTDGVDTTPATTPAPTPSATPSTTPSWSSAGDGDVIDDGLPASSDVDLTDTDVAGLLWMREEEQLAHDVYVALGDIWDLRIFENIAASETSHIEAVIELLDRYGIADPAEGNEPGTFTDPALQDLYDRLLADGRESLEAALRVGASIEELDIDDLQARAASTDLADIDTVYANLERGSRNHLRAFVTQLGQRGANFEPSTLDLATFDAIVSSATERGRDG